MTGRQRRTRLTGLQGERVQMTIRNSRVARRTSLDYANGHAMVYAMVRGRSVVISSHEKWEEFCALHLPNHNHKEELEDVEHG